MFSNRLIFAALGAACIAAAAAGGYVASRQTVTPTSVAASAAPSAELAPATIPDRPVQETEAVIGDTPAPRAATSKPAAPVAAARRPEAPARSTARETKPAQAATPRQDPAPTLDRSWPSSSGSTQSPATSNSTSSPASAGSAATDPSATPSHVDDRAAQEPARAPEPPQKTFEELVVAADSVIGLQTETPLTSERARVEDRVEARVTRDVKVGDKMAIPAGARAIGSVTQVDRGGKFKERARLGIRFHTLVLADGTRLPITTETIFRDGTAPGNQSAAKIGGGAVGGAILGAILGGAKGAVIGATTGAGAGTAVVAAGDRNAATLPAGEPLTVRLSSPVTVTIEK
jgi:type IV secretory pathway VirB10-like protein